MTTRFVSNCIISTLFFFAVVASAQQTTPETRTEPEKIAELRRRAEAGDAKAQNELGVAYRMGEGIPKDKNEAVNWYRKAARQNYPDGLFNLGISYYNGDGVATDEVLSYAWLTIAESAGSAEARAAKAQIASDWRPSRLIRAKVRLAEIYAEGKDYPRNDSAAFALLKEAAEAGDSGAQFVTCRFLAQGRGVAKDPEEAFSWCHKASKFVLDAALALAEMYEKGIGTKQDFKNAASMYESVTQYSPEAAFKLAQFYGDGGGLPKDEVLQCAWLMFASNHGHKQALLELDRVGPQVTDKQWKKAQEIATKWCPVCQKFERKKQ
jgi:TPR repeat protein